ncbi:hypothetical protein [Bradyrhizobium sp. USDA 4503]
MIEIQAISDKDWPTAIRGSATASIAVSIRQLKKHVIGAVEVDAALSAVLACAIEGDMTSPVILSSALRRRSKIDPKCGRLVELWQGAKVPSFKDSNTQWTLLIGPRIRISVDNVSLEQGFENAIAAFDPALTQRAGSSANALRSKLGQKIHQ